jgi:hypothetical protein
MRCIECGAEMRLLERSPDRTMMVRGYWHQTFECPNCRKAERRLIFDRTKRSLTGRNVHVSYAPSHGNYVAIDSKCGLIVLKHQDRKRLMELCEWVGWQVIEEEVQVTHSLNNRPS